MSFSVKKDSLLSKLSLPVFTDPNAGGLFFILR